MIKSLGKVFLSRLFESQVRTLRRQNDFKIVAVVGSVGKTSTKLAIAGALSGSLRVRYQDGNYNDRLTVPLALFNQSEPNIFGIFAWLRILLRNRRCLRQPYPYDVAVLELGIDAPDQMKHFSYLQPDFVVVTGVSAEHLEFLKSLDVVASEELLALTFSKQAVLNIDDIPAQYLPDQEYVSFGLSKGDYHLLKRSTRDLAGQDLELRLADDRTLKVGVQLIGDQGAKAVLAAAAVSDLLGVSEAALISGLEHVTAVPGRMQILPGVNSTTVIDDTYNASPVAVKAALDVLYSVDAPQRIAILGSMNEMGNDSPAMHQEVGAYCDPAKLDLVVTIGQDAGQYLGSAAEKRGCQVQRFDHPLAAGQYVAAQVQSGAVILAKGSQNKVFAEEALVPLLANPADKSKLVRQSAYWQHRKAQSLK